MEELSTVMKDVIKQCNVCSSQCHGSYNLTERAEKELAGNPNEPKRYLSRYDSCDSVSCQLAGAKPKSMLGG